jgi:luciferase family oxidoreductase group 1
LTASGVVWPVPSLKMIAQGTRVVLAPPVMVNISLGPLVPAAPTVAFPGPEHDLSSTVKVKAKTGFAHRHGRRSAAVADGERCRHSFAADRVMRLPMVPLSILDLVRVTEQTAAREAMDNARDVAAYAEALGYRRFWVAEHHNMRGIASAATSVVIAHIAAGTNTIRVGAGGIMLPNHSPLVIAEQFGTLATLFGHRIDLGLGRAPGTDPFASLALRRDPSTAEHFPQDVLELQAFLAEPQPGQRVVAVPGAGTNVPLWILGSSTFGARLSAELGLPYAFASHFAPASLDEALLTYRTYFKPSQQLSEPYAMIGVNIIAADTDAQARRLATTQQMSITGIVRNARSLSKPPIDDIETYWTPAEKAEVQQWLAVSVYGSPEKVRGGIERLLERTKADELMIVSDVFDHTERLRSFELIAEAVKTPSRV